MRVFAKKAFEFTRRESKDGQQVVAEKVTTSPLKFCDLPDWVQKDPMFAWARQDGDIELIQTAADQKNAELTANVRGKGNKVGSKSLTKGEPSNPGDTVEDATQKPVE
ncbi:hypothetical protein JCM15765_03860 [Paradesulfitobacterium aromaticivorans]